MSLFSAGLEKGPGLGVSGTVLKARVCTRSSGVRSEYIILFQYQSNAVGYESISVGAGGEGECAGAHEVTSDESSKNQHTGPDIRPVGRDARIQILTHYQT